VQLLAALEVEPLHQLARQDEPIGIADLFDFNFHRRVSVEPPRKTNV
jgi:hypothetical protein